MRPFRATFFFLIVFISVRLNALGQTCTGSLGDPVINQDFGSGANPGAPLSSGVTNMTYNQTGCPNDGDYTIANSIVGDCFGGTWHALSHDHTGNPNGYMMVVNASYQPSVFFTQTANGLCPGTTYEFAAWIMNLMVPSGCGGASIKPNITFSVSASDGTLLQTYNTGDIPATNTGQWVKYGLFFTTPANTSSVIVTMTNNASGGCGNDIALDDITFRACGPVINLGFASTSGLTDEEICEGSNATYTLKADVVGSNNPIYQWQYNYGKGWSDMSGKTANTLDIGFVNAKPGSYQYRLGVANGSNISSVQCRVYSPALTVNVNPLPVVPPIAPQTVCRGSTLQLSASGGNTYVWTGPNMSPSSQNPLVINNVDMANAGTYTVQAYSASGCTAAPTQVKVTVLPKVTANISSNVTLCSGEVTQLVASGGTHYKWTPSAGLNNDTIPNPIASPQQTTVYSVDVSNGACNDNSKFVTVTVNQSPVADAGSNKTIFEGQSVKLNGTMTGDNITSFFWSPSIYLSDPSSLTPVANPPDDITYTLYVNSQTCGTSTSNVFVKVYKEITVPNTFSPNNDGINDYWNITALVTYPQSLTTVFNRYGQKVFQSTGYAKPWDGTYNGSPLPEGTYYYVIDLKNNTSKIAGWVFIAK